MNLTDLRDELTAHADDLGAAPDFRAGVAARVRTTKRRRAATAGGAATLVLAALAVGVITSLGRPAPTLPAGTSSAAPMIGTDGMPFRPVPDAPGDIVKAGLRLRAQVAGDRLAAGAIGDAGVARVSVDWVPTTTKVSLTGGCYAPGASAARAQNTELRIRVEGMEGYLGASSVRPCLGAPTQRDLPAGGWTPGEPGQGWTELEVGKPATLVIELVDRTTGKLVDLPGVRVVGAVYDLGEQTPIEDAAGEVLGTVPVVVEHEGYRYRLAGMVVGPLASGPLPVLGVPTGPVVVSWGSVGTRMVGPSTAGDGSLRLDGLRDGSEALSFGVWGTTPVPADTTTRVTLVAEGARPDHGKAFIAIYTLAT